jgi:hypothetical protein
LAPSIATTAIFQRAGKLQWLSIPSVPEFTRRLHFARPPFGDRALFLAPSIATTSIFQRAGKLQMLSIPSGPNFSQHSMVGRVVSIRFGFFRRARSGAASGGPA